MNNVKETTIRAIVKTAVESFAAGFGQRHEGEVDNPDGVINMKIHNVFIEALGEEVRYYNALVRSLDSSLGNMLEKLAINIASLNYSVERQVEGPLAKRQTAIIAELLEEYKSRQRRPSVSDYQSLRDVALSDADNKRHDSDYYLIDEKSGNHYLIELKIGGDLDNKKSRSEKEAILEQFAILSNTLPRTTDIQIRFATAYNRYGEDNEWKQTRVLQFFAQEELLIGRDFWNFICKSQYGYDIVISEYRKHSGIIRDALEGVRKLYLSQR